MKKYLFIFVIGFLFTSCLEDIYLEELNNSPSKIVIEANIIWNKDDVSLTQTQTIKLSKTASFYNNNYETVTGAIITLYDNNNVVIANFIDQNNGNYTATISKPTYNQQYHLKIEVDGKTYTAQTTFTSVVSINEIKQETVFFPTAVEEVKVNIDNEIGVNNFYLFKAKSKYTVIPEYSAGDDLNISEEIGENNFDIPYINDKIKTGDVIDFEIWGISKGYQTYLNKVFLIAQGSNGPFSTAPVSVRGNIINTTNNEDYPLGYFSINEIVKTSYTVQ